MTMGMKYGVYSLATARVGDSNYGDDVECWSTSSDDCSDGDDLLKMKELMRAKISNSGVRLTGDDKKKQCLIEVGRRENAHQEREREINSRRKNPCSSLKSAIKSGETHYI